MDVVNTPFGDTCTITIFASSWLRKITEPRFGPTFCRAMPDLSCIICSQLGLSTPVRLLGQGPLATLPGCDVLALRTAGSRLARLLEDGFPLPLGQLLASAGHRRILRATTLAALCDVYAQLHAAVHDPANGYPDPSLLLPVPPEEIRAKLLPVQPSETPIKAVESP